MSAMCRRWPGSSRRESLPFLGSFTQPLQPATVPIQGKKFSDIWMRAVIGNNLPTLTHDDVVGYPGIRTRGAGLGSPAADQSVSDGRCVLRSLSARGESIQYRSSISRGNQLVFRSGTTLYQRRQSGKAEGIFGIPSRSMRCLPRRRRSNLSRWAGRSAPLGVGPSGPKPTTTSRMDEVLNWMRSRSIRIHAGVGRWGCIT